MNNKKAVLSHGNRSNAAAVVFGLKFTDNIHCKPSFQSRASEIQMYRRKTEFNAKWPF